MLAMISFVVYAVGIMRDEDISRYTTLPVMLGILIFAIVYTSIIPISAWAWGRLLADTGKPIPWGELGMIMAITQMAKYLPGNVGQHIGRAAMSLSRGIGIQPLALTVLIESILALFAALLVGLIGASLSQTGLLTLLRGNETLLISAVATACAVMFGLMTSRRWLFYLIHRYTTVYADSQVPMCLPRRTTLFLSLSAYCLNYILIGVGLVILARLLIPEVVIHDVMLLTSSFALAWVFGFFTPGAPAGLGVREVIMLGMLSSYYSASNGIFLIISLRLATTIGDGLCFLVGNLMLLISNRRKKQLKIAER
jgi:glycosyltransferase 2 family protein